MAEYADCQPVARIGEACLRALVERAQLGDEAAFEAIYGDLAPRVLRFVRHYLGDPDLAEEVMQVTFMRVIEGLHRYQVRDRVPFAAWVFRIARNAAVDARRSSHLTATLEIADLRAASTNGPFEMAVAAIERERLAAALATLPPAQHDVLVYRFLAELTPAEVARLMNRSEGAVRVLQHRAIGALRRRLAPAVLVAAVAREAS